MRKIFQPIPLHDIARWLMVHGMTRKPKPKPRRSPKSGYVIRGADDLWPAIEKERARRGLRSRNETILALLRDALSIGSQIGGR